MGSNHRPVFVLLTIVSLLGPSWSMATEASCQSVFSAEIHSINGDWRPTPGDKFMGFRSNAPHFWNWLKQQNSALFKFRGHVAGDVHILNFGDIPTKSEKIKWGFNDFDDSGVQVPLAGDLIRLMAGSKVSPYNVSDSALIAAYKAGLAQKEYAKPSILEKIEKESEFSKKQEKYIKKLTTDDRFSKDAELQDIFTAPADIQNSFKDVLPLLKEQLKDAQILDQGYKIKSTGGSQGLVRFWILIERQGHKHILELKTESDPAVSLFATQPGAEERLTHFKTFYRPSTEEMGPYKILNSSSQTFLLRERLVHLIDFDPKKIKSSEDIASGKEVTLFIAYQLGAAHGVQPSGKSLLESLQKNSQMEEDILSLSESYFHIINEH